MNFADLVTDGGLAVLNDWMQKRTYIYGHNLSQSDIATFKAVEPHPDATKYPHVARWYKHVGAFRDGPDTFAVNPGKPYTVNASNIAEAALNPAKAHAAAVATAEVKEDQAKGDVDHPFEGEYDNYFEDYDKNDDDDDDDGDDDFDYEDGDSEAARAREEHLAELRKDTRAKSVVSMDIMPPDREVDMQALEDSVRSIQRDGLVWGDSQLIPVGFGFRKLQINLVVEDEKVSVEDVVREVQGLEDYVQTTDVTVVPML